MLTLRTTLLILLVLAVAVCCTAQPASNTNVGFALQQGWYDGQVAWYSFFGSNNIDWVSGLGLPRSIAAPFQPNLALYLQCTDYTLYPKLGSALAGGASPVYFVTNFQQGPVFTAIPGEAGYSGLWIVNLVTWKAGVIPRTITDAADLPGPAEADIVAINVVIDAPIMATGALGGPWLPAPAGRYRIPQALGVEPFGARKIIVLPARPVYVADQITKRSAVAYLVITDIADASLATRMQANYAPALADLDDLNTEALWYFDRDQIPPPPVGQYLVMEHTVTFNHLLAAYMWYRPLNLNFDVSPVVNGQKLIRGTIPAYTTVNNPALVKKLLGGGLLTDGIPIKMNTYLGVRTRQL